MLDMGFALVAGRVALVEEAGIVQRMDWKQEGVEVANLVLGLEAAVVAIVGVGILERGTLEDRKADLQEGRLVVDNKAPEVGLLLGIVVVVERKSGLRAGS